MSNPTQLGAARSNSIKCNPIQTNSASPHSNLARIAPNTTQSNPLQLSPTPMLSNSTQLGATRSNSITCNPIQTNTALPTIQCSLALVQLHPIQSNEAPFKPNRIKQAPLWSNSIQLDDQTQSKTFQCQANSTQPIGQSSPTQSNSMLLNSTQSIFSKARPIPKQLNLRSNPASLNQAPNDSIQLSPIKHVLATRNQAR